MINSRRKRGKSKINKTSHENQQWRPRGDRHAVHSNNEFGPNLFRPNFTAAHTYCGIWRCYDTVFDTAGYLLL